jgi:hypothetical protein
MGTDSGTTSPPDATQRAQQTASTAAEESRHVAGVAADEARSVAAEATEHARNLVGDARTQLQGQVDEQTRQQKDRLAGTLSTFGDDLASMAENSSGLASDVAHEVADRARTLSRHLDGREPTELLDDVRRFARQRPGAFLLGALAAGVVVGRLARGAKDAIEAAEGTSQGHQDAAAPRATPGARSTTSAHASHGQPTLPPNDIPASATGFSTPPIGTGLPGASADELRGGSTP